MTADTLISALDVDPVARLRWRVLEHFRVPPGCADDMAMSDADALWAAANMVMDARLAGEEAGRSRPFPAGSEDGSGRAEAGFDSTAFDEARFLTLKEAGHGT